MNDFQVAIASVLGSMLVLVAMWLLLVKREAGRSKFKLFGLEFESDTPAIIVLLAGCGLLIGPGFTERRAGGWPPLLAGAAGDASPSRAGAPSWTEQRTAVVDVEAEPNDSVGQANEIQLGQAVRGSIKASKDQRHHDPHDFFLLADHASQDKDRRFILRVLGAGDYLGGMICLTIWDEREQELLDQCAKDTISVSVPPYPAYVLRVTIRRNLGEAAWAYELLARVET